MTEQLWNDVVEDGEREESATAANERAQEAAARIVVRIDQVVDALRIMRRRVHAIYSKQAMQSLSFDLDLASKVPAKMPDEVRQWLGQVVFEEWDGF